MPAVGEPEFSSATGDGATGVSFALGYLYLITTSPELMSLTLTVI